MKAKLLTAAMISAVLLQLSAISTAASQELRPAEARPDRVGAAWSLATAKADTVDLLGGPGRSDGRFQDDYNPMLPDWEGWTSIDLTAPGDTIWHIDTFNSPDGSNAMWCGEAFAACGPDDVAGGYGNHYDEALDWLGIVSDANQPTNVTIVFDMNIDVEPGYDFLTLLRRTDTGWVELASYNTSTWNGTLGVWEPLLDETHTFTVPPADHTGPGGDTVHLRFRATSDHMSSDADCLWPSAGHTQLDNIDVSGDNGLAGTFTDFEAGLPGTGWRLSPRRSVGDFAKIWPMLFDLDLCSDNITPQVAFIDDGIVVPCTGGTPGVSWTYGPGGYIHNLTGGCADETFHLANEIWSPPLAWADGGGTPLGATHPGVVLAFDVYDHLPIQNGLYFTWSVRTSQDGGATWTGWRDRSRAYYGSGQWRRVSEDVSDLAIDDPTHIQLALGAHEWGWIWNFVGTDGTPAPYFDNVSLKVYASDGPLITADELDLAQDSFPAVWPVDPGDPGLSHIRFDMARDLIGGAAPAIAPGDSIVVTVETKRPGAVLTGPPELHYAMGANPVFDPYRAHPTSGLVLGVEIPAGPDEPTAYAFDLPDEDFFYPGDVIHYYIRAEDSVGGDLRQTTLPSDLTGFGIFPLDPGYVPLAWSSLFTVHGLPTVLSLAAGAPRPQPPILYYDDFGTEAGETAWLSALADLGFIEGYHFDVFRTNAPHLYGSNGLASRAGVAGITGYETVLYSCGDRPMYTLSTFHQHVDKCDDLALMDGWLQLGRNLLATGDNLGYDVGLLQGFAGFMFAETWFSVDVADNDVRSRIGGQSVPTVLPVGGNSLLLDVDMVAYGGCPKVNTFDAIEPLGAAERIAEWADPAGQSGAYPYLAAGVRHQTMGSDVILYAADLTFWYASPTSPPGQWAPAGVLGDILGAFGHMPIVDGVDDPPLVLAARQSPNPFNPVTEIRFDLPRDGRVQLRVFDVRGAVVRTLLDAELPAGRDHAVRWNGLDDRGAAAASGVYFYRLDAGERTVLGKMALIR